MSDTRQVSPGFAYSLTWFETFMQTISPTQTETELDFLQGHLQLEKYAKVLDVCCGTGRHSKGLAKRGYTVTGVDISDLALAEARANPEGATFLNLDMLELSSLPGPFDAIVCLWQSFGFLDSASNQKILEDMVNLLGPNGRLVVDIYNRHFFEKNLGEGTSERNGETIHEKKSMSGDRLKVEINYSSQKIGDIFEWQIFYPNQIITLLENMGLELLHSCTAFDNGCSPNEQSPRAQYIFERV